jgi:hypothetical protein
MSSVLSQLLEVNKIWVSPRIDPEIVLIVLGINNGCSVSGSGSPDNHFKIGHVSRYSSILFMEGHGHGNLAYTNVFEVTSDSESHSVRSIFLCGDKFSCPRNNWKNDIGSLPGGTHSWGNFCTAF